ncbi:MAG: DUF4390 domain-containing protein [Gemmatimonadota bacterium]
MRRIAVPFILLVLALAPGLSAASSTRQPRITGIHGQVTAREARVEFAVSDAFSPEMVEALKSGIEVSFKTTIRVERVHRHWFNATLAERVITRSVRYDVLSRVYRLRREDGEVLVPDLFDAIAGMTRYDVTLPVSGEVVRGKKYRAYVKTRLDRVGLSEPLRSIFFFSSLWDLETGWEKGGLNAP